VRVGADCRHCRGVLEYQLKLGTLATKKAAYIRSMHGNAACRHCLCTLGVPTQALGRIQSGTDRGNQHSMRFVLLAGMAEAYWEYGLKPWDGFSQGRTGGTNTA